MSRYTDDNEDDLEQLVRLMKRAVLYEAIRAWTPSEVLAIVDRLGLPVLRAPPVCRPEAPTVPDGRSTLPPFVPPKPPAPSRGRK